MRSHADIQELLGVYALDALDPDEAEVVESHLPTCPRCRAELSAHREVTGLFAYAGQEAPAGLWDRITTSLQEIPPPLSLERIRSSSRLEQDWGAEAAWGGPPAPSAGPGSAGRRSVGPRSPGRGLRRGWRTTVAVAAAAAVVVALLGVQVAHLQHRVNAISTHLQAGPGNLAPTATLADVRTALRAPGSRRTTLFSLGGGRATADAVVMPNGVGYLFDIHITPLPADRTYQLWGVVGSQRISYGLLGTDPRIVEFQAGMGLQALAVTDEIASGVVISTQAPVVVGAVSPPL